MIDNIYRRQSHPGAKYLTHMHVHFLRGPVVKNPSANAGEVDSGSISGWEKSPGVGNGNLFQYSCLENSMDRGVWQATAHGVTKSWTLQSIHM